MGDLVTVGRTREQLVSELTAHVEEANAIVAELNQRFPRLHVSIKEGYTYGARRALEIWITEHVL